jgi:hypothetical protein
MTSKVRLGSEFGRAFCEHFGLPANQVCKVTPHADQDEIMHAKVEIALTPDDLAGIAIRMGAASVVALEPLKVREFASSGPAPGYTRVGEFVAAESAPAAQCTAAPSFPVRPLGAR